MRLHVVFGHIRHVLKICDTFIVLIDESEEKHTEKQTDDISTKVKERCQIKLEVLDTRACNISVTEVSATALR